MNDCPPFVANGDLDEVVEVDSDGLRCVAQAHFGFYELWQSSLLSSGLLLSAQRSTTMPIPISLCGLYTKKGRRSRPRPLRRRPGFRVR
jgi:hypothetical protein